MTATAGELYQEGRLTEAIEAQTAEVRAKPGDPGRRMFLFELLAFAGDLDRARKQVEAIRFDDPPLDAAVLEYRALIESEAARRRLFNEGVLPEYLMAPPFHQRMRVDAVANFLLAHLPVEAAGLIAGATQASPTIGVSLNGTSHETLRDADDVFGTVLEVMAKGKYFWVPLEQVESITMNPPKYPRDLIWARARLTTKDGPSGEVYLPALYPNSYNHPDDRIKLGRMTDWLRIEGDFMLGVGLRTFVAGEEAVSLLEWRELVVDKVA